MTTNTFPQTHTPSNHSHTKAKNITAWTLQILVALAFLAAASMKLAGPPEVIDMFNKIGLGQPFRYLTASLEITGALLLLFPRTPFYGALLLMLIMLGAITTHLTLIGGNPTPAIVLLLLNATIAYLRRPSRTQSPPR
jgi:putative oxidoreductase